MQRLNHHHLYIFWVFSKTESVTKTSQELSIAQSAVTSQLKQLELSLGMELIDRSQPRYPEITLEGKRVLAYANSIFETTRELINWATKGDLSRQQMIRMGSLSGLSRNLQFEFLSPLIQQNDTKVMVTTGDQEKLVEMLRHHELDLILSSHNVKAEKGGHFYSHVLTSSPLVFVCLKKIPKKNLEAHALHRPLFIPGEGFEARPELDAFLKLRKMEHLVRGEIDDVALLRLMALRSEALVAMPEMGVRNDLLRKEVQVVERIDSISQKFYAITRSRQVVNPLIETLIKNMRDSF